MRRAAGLCLILAVAVAAVVAQAQAPAPAAGVRFSQIKEADAREWLTYLSSDLLEGREAFTEGYGLAAAYVADHLREWGVKPLGDQGSYFQVVQAEVDLRQPNHPSSVRRTRNVVGLIEGTDPVLKKTYVLFGAHLDHVGYAGDPGEPKGRVNVPIEQDPIWNGADDDGTGSTAVLAIAKALATGPRPKRSVVVIWHAGEEEGLLGSHFMADHPVVPLDAIQAEFNIDMIGRNRDDDPAMANTVFVIGADRISTDLHNLIVRANAALPPLLRLDYEYNAPDDPNDFYTRSDHYSYASRGIPIAFFFTGTHADYHANTDSVDKILFPKLVRIAQMVYQAGFSVAAAGQPLIRDNLGPRTGRGFQGLLSR